MGVGRATAYQRPAGWAWTLSGALACGVLTVTCAFGAEEPAPPVREKLDTDGPTLAEKIHAPAPVERPAERRENTVTPAPKDGPGGEVVEIEPDPVPRPAGPPRPGDPEWFREFPDSSEPPAIRTARRAGLRVPLAGDPELPRAWPADENGLPAPLALRIRRSGPRPGDPELPRVGWPADEAVPVSPVRHAALPGAPADEPRFVIGEGLDEPDALPVPAQPVRRATAVKGAQAHERRTPLKPDGKEKLPADPEERFKDLLTKVHAQKEEWERRREESETRAQAREKARPDGANAEEADWVRSRSPRAAEALKAFFENRPLGVLQGRILDPETRLPVPARVRVVDDSDTAASARIPDLGFWCDGTFSTPVLAGKVRVEIGGDRFRPTFVKGVDVRAGTATVVEALLGRPRILDFSRTGWYAADLDLALRAPRGSLPLWTGPPPELEDAALAARAEGVQVLGLVLPADGERNTLPEAGLPEELARCSRGVLLLPVFPGPQHAFCGSAQGVGMRTWAGLPVCLSDPRQGLRDAFEQIRECGGLAVYAELAGRRSIVPARDVLPVFPRLSKDGFLLPSDASALLYAPAELPFASVAGPAYDALAFDGSEAAQALWFNLLDEGYAVPALGSGGGSLEGGQAPFARTFVRLDGPVTAEGVVEACRKGRSMVSFGPAVFAEILERGKGPGERVPADGRPLTLVLRAFASMTVGARLEAVEIVRNGQVVHREQCAEGLTQLQDFRYPLTERQDAWYVVRASERVGKDGARQRRAWTNPLYFDTPGRTPPAPAVTRLRGTLRRAGGTPLSGTLVVLEPGQERREARIGADGCFDVKLSAAGAAIFVAPGCEPVVRRPFESPRVQKALGALVAERNGTLREQLARRATFGLWRLLLSEWDGDVELHELAVRVPNGRAGEHP